MVYPEEEEAKIGPNPVTKKFGKEVYVGQLDHVHTVECRIKDHTETVKCIKLMDLFTWVNGNQERLMDLESTSLKKVHTTKDSSIKTLLKDKENFTLESSSMKVILKITSIMERGLKLINSTVSTATM